MPKFIATAEFDEENIGSFGQGDTAEEAFQDFVGSGEFQEHCYINGFHDGEEVEVGVYQAINKDSPEWDDSVFDEDWEWALGDEAYTKKVEFLIA